MKAFKPKKHKKFLQKVKVKAKVLRNFADMLNRPNLIQGRRKVMDISGLGGAAALQAAQAGNEIGIKMLKASQEQSKTQLDLINAIPAPPAQVSGGIDVSA